MLSRMKKDLEALEDPPPDEYLSKLALSKKEHNTIRKLNNDVRKRGAMSVHVVSNADAIVLQAMQYMTPSDPNLLLRVTCCQWYANRTSQNGAVLNEIE